MWVSVCLNILVIWACICTDSVYDNIVKSYKITTKPASTYYEQNGPFTGKSGNRINSLMEKCRK